MISIASATDFSRRWRHEYRLPDRCGQPAAFTLVELLAVLTIIGALVGLLLPAIQSARESARRTECSNNAKQIALACATYESGNGKLPPGGYTAFGITWWHALLPFMEAADLAAKYDPRYAYSYSTTPYTNLAVITSLVNNMTCPSDSGPRKDNADQWWRYNYVCNAGNVGLTWTSTGGLSRLASRVTGSTTITNGEAPFRFEGTSSSAAAGAVTGYIAGKTPPQIQLRNVTDGLSKTLSFAECLRGTNGSMQSGNTGSDLRGYAYLSNVTYFSAWQLPNSPSLDRIAGSTNTCRSTPTAPCTGFGTKPQSVDQAARSSHTGGVMVSMLDGSTTFVEDNIDWLVWQAMSTTQGGEQ